MAQFESRATSEDDAGRAIASLAPLGLLILAVTTALVGARSARFLIPSVCLGTAVASLLISGGVIQV